jgi:hypothetical protein
MAPAHLFQSALALTDLARFYREVRQTSERLGEPLSDADATVQSMIRHGFLRRWFCRLT